MELVVRPAEADDATGLLQLLMQLQNESSTFMVANDLSAVDGVTEADNIEYLQTTTNNIILVMADEQANLYGVISAAAIPGQPRVAEIGVAVLEKYQGHGFAQILLEELLLWAHDFSSIEKLVLTVQAQNLPAVHIYEKYGFTRITASTTQILNTRREKVTAFDMERVVEK
ncbi:GNAT family N-acetyltransferase [Weissella soli]|uniref:GNAT family N-acetyltransferase n=1 Tax=Weissella soli TaxID=155866 RepID=UPI0035A0EB3F